MHDVRPAAVAGMFYPRAPDRLAGDVRAYLSEASRRDARAPKALIVPHAGYVYSGPIAAAAYALLAPLRDTVERVVLLGPAHRVAVRGLALPDARAFATPLGAVPIDAAGGRCGARRCRRSSRAIAAHAHEHSLEVQLPFLQRVLGDFTLVPFAVGTRHARRGRRGPRRAVGRTGDADRRQLGPVALSPVRRGQATRPRDRRRDPRAVADARSRAGLRRDADQRPPARARSAAASRPRCSTCATRATPRAIARASSATRRSHSLRDDAGHAAA